MLKNFVGVTGAAALLVGVCLPLPSSATGSSPIPPEPVPSVASDAGSKPDVIASREQLHLDPTFDAGHVPFSIRINGIDTSWTTMSAFVMPGQTLELSASGGAGTFSAEAAAGTLAATGTASWKWTAPAQSGSQQIRVRNADGSKTAIIEAFVLTPYDGNGSMGSYTIGEYQSAAKDGNPAYNRPAGFVEVTAQNIDTRLSPHFRLGQFLCKGSNSFPKYVALQTALLVKLENLMEALADRGLPAETLHVMSGYRTPAYNAGIGNETTYSRHTYGDAADVFLDRDGDGKMDDLDHDGASTKEDARILYQLVEDTLDPKLPGEFAGGLAIYSPTPSHGPFVHIDTRGKRARW